MLRLSFMQWKYLKIKITLGYRIQIAKKEKWYITLLVNSCLEKSLGKVFKYSLKP